MSHGAKKYELNIEVHECNEPTELHPATANQLIGQYICQVRRGESL